MSLRETYQTVSDSIDASFNPFSQSKLLSNLPADDPSKRGICRALCLYEAHFAKADRSKDFKREVDTIVAKACELQESVHVQKAASVAEALTELYTQQAPSLGLSYVGISHFQPGVYNWLQGAVGYATRHPYYVQMLLPNHVVSVRPSKQGGICFFDPNVGQISCPKAELFYVLHKLFNNSKVSSSYLLGGTPEIFLVYLA